jgi:hypothetical protein
MDERHEFQFAGIWLPRHVMEMVAARRLNPTDIILYAMIAALQGKRGCWATNEYLAGTCEVHLRKVQESLAKMKELGLVQQVHFDGRRRYLKVVAEGGDIVPARAEVPTDGTAEGTPNGTSGVPTDGTQNSTQLKTIQPEAGAASEVGVRNGFGLVEVLPAGKATEEDTRHAATLRDAVRRHLPGRAVNLANWAEHFRLLREHDKAPTERIAAALAWYGENIGGQFTPQIFSGEAFRKKFPQLEKQVARDLTLDTPPTPEAVAVAGRLRMLGWPKGSGEALPAAVQRSLDAYRTWCHRVCEMRRRLKMDDLAEDIGTWRQKLLVFGDWLYNGKHGGPEYFVEMHFQAVHRRVTGWHDWRGNLEPFVFDPEGKDFQEAQHAAAADFCGQPSDYWTRFKELMEQEL